jgi:uncharacterized damage-inducible protein DinB
MAKYNLRLNTQVYEAAGQLSEDELLADMGAFFKSILGTLNHILVGDLLWLNRFASIKSFSSLQALKDFPKPLSLDQILFEDFRQLKRTRIELDTLIHEWLHTNAIETDFQQNLTYRNSKGEVATKNFTELLHHFFNHQTHHRGQVSTLLNQKGIDVGLTDFVIDISASS